MYNIHIYIHLSEVSASDINLHVKQLHVLDINPYKSQLPNRGTFPLKTLRSLSCSLNFQNLVLIIYVMMWFFWSIRCVIITLYILEVVCPSRSVWWEVSHTLLIRYRVVVFLHCPRTSKRWQKLMLSRVPPFKFILEKVHNIQSSLPKLLQSKLSQNALCSVLRSCTTPLNEAQQASFGLYSKWVFTSVTLAYNYWVSGSAKGHIYSLWLSFWYPYILRSYPWMNFTKEGHALFFFV